MAVEKSSGVSSTVIARDPIVEETVQERPVAEGAAKRPVTPESRDVVQTAATAKAPDGGTTALERRVAELESQLKARDDADRVEKEKEAQEAKESGWFKRALLKIFEFALRVFVPFVNLISLCARVIQGIKDGKWDWKGIAADALGFFLPAALAIPLGPLALPVGGLIAGGWDLGNDILNGKDKSRVFGWETDQESGLRVAGRKIKELGGEMWDGAKKIGADITGKEVERKGDDKGIASDPVTPREVET